MYCPHCGKEMENSAKFCPHCGGKNLNPVQVAPCRSVASGSGTAGLTDLFRWILVALGAIHVLMFFLLSYADNQYLSILGLDVPGKMTALNYIRFSLGVAEYGLVDESVALVNLVVCLIPLCLGIVTLLSSLKGLSKKGCILTIVLAGVCLLDYLILGVAFQAAEQLGYETTAGGAIACLVSLAQLGVAIASLVMASKKKSVPAAGGQQG